MFGTGNPRGFGHDECRRKKEAASGSWFAGESQRRSITIKLLARVWRIACRSNQQRLREFSHTVDDCPHRRRLGNQGDDVNSPLTRTSASVLAADSQLRSMNVGCGSCTAPYPSNWPGPLPAYGGQTHGTVEGSESGEVNPQPTPSGSANRIHSRLALEAMQPLFSSNLAVLWTDPRGCGHRDNLRCRCSTTAVSRSPKRRRRERRASSRSQSGAIMVNQVSCLSMSR